MTELALTRLSDVKPERLQWLWPGRLPTGKIATLDGDPGLGKSTLALDIAATVTNGGPWPDGGHCEHPGDVLLLSGEDGLADTVAPRAIAAGADTSRIHAIEGKSAIDPDTGERYLQSITLADVLMLKEAMARVGAALLIVDVLMAFLPGGVDAHKDQDIRRVLTALSKAADTSGCTVLLLRHLNKTKGADPLYRGGGSIGIVGAARSGLLVTADPNDPARRVLATVKSNLAQMPTALAYRLADSPEHGVARVQWDGTVNYQAAELLAGPSVDEDNDRSDVDDWLTTLLKAGPVESAEVYKAADAAGFSKDKAKRAKKRIGVKAYKSSGDGPWMWTLETKGADDQGSTPDTQNRAPLLPCTSEGVHETPNRPREQGADDCSLATFDLCRHCGEPLKFEDDRRTGWHSDRTACVKAQQADQRPHLAVVDSTQWRPRPYNKSDGKPSCRDWLRSHLDDHLASGRQYLESAEVYKAGAAADHSKAAIGNAVFLLKAEGRIRTAGKTGRAEQWCIDPAETVSYIPVSDFVSAYLDTLDPGTVAVDQTHFYAAAEQAGIERDTARKVLVRDSGRIDSKPAHGDSKSERTWHIRRASGDC